MNKDKKGKKILGIFALLILVFLCLFVILSPHGKKNYLFIGMDNYGSLNETGRSDTMLLVHLDFDKHKIGLVTFARDLLLNYKNSDTKVNTIIRFGGEEGLVSTIEDSFDLHIDGWFRLNFSSLVSIIEEIGGVTVELTDAEAKYINHSIGIYPENPLSEGPCLLNGGQALSYVRCRRLDNDFGRGSRQSKLVKALIKESCSMGIPRIIELYNNMKHAWRSNLTDSEQFRLLYSCIFLRHADVTREGIPFEHMYQYKNSSTGDNGVAINLEKTVQALHEAISF